MITNNQLNNTELENIISKSRLTTYNNEMALYIWNAKLAENFFFLLQNLEVGLRNSIYNGFYKNYPNEDFFYLYETNLKNRYLSKKEFHSRECWKMLCAVKHKLKKNNISLSDDNIISELNFGFWTKILQDKQYSNIWRVIFNDVFPNKNIKYNVDKSRLEVAKIFNTLRFFRNRIFHYEPIFNKNPKIYHREILNAIEWISKDLYLISMKFDEFGSILKSKESISDKLTVSNQPKVSIVTSVYNNKETIKDAIESVINQTYENIEYIIIDGNSSDGTVEIVKSYGSAVTKFISESDKGIYDGLNKGVNVATGDIVTFLHSDDLYENSEVVAKVVAAFMSEDVDGVYGDLVYTPKDNTDKVLRYWKSKDFDISLLKKGWMPAHPTLFLKREVYEKFGQFDLDFKIAGDYDFMLRVLSGGIKVKYLPQVLYKMRVGGESNKSLKNIILKSREDLRALRKNGVGGVFTLVIKNFSKVGQFLWKG